MAQSVENPAPAASNSPAPTADTRGHFAVQVTDLPPTEIVCKCGARFVGGDVIAKQKAHMDALNDPPPNDSFGAG